MFVVLALFGIVALLLHLLLVFLPTVFFVFELVRVVSLIREAADCPPRLRSISYMCRKGPSQRAYPRDGRNLARSLVMVFHEILRRW
jgi:hypothetical protein